MDSRILKYKLEWFLGKQRIPNVPVGACILSMQIQNGYPTIWVLVDDAVKAMEPWWIEMRFTGEPFNENGMMYIATLQNNDGLVYHAFKRY